MRASAAALFLALGLFGVALLSGAPAAAQQFSADLVSTNAHGRREDAAGKLYVGPGIVRIEPPGVRNGRFLTDPGASLFLMPAQRVFMDAKQSSRLTQILTPVDPNNPCPAWDAMAKIAGSDRGGHWACETLAAGGGGGTIKYRVTSPGGETGYAWVDSRLKFPVRFQFADGAAIALDHIRAGPQPAALFAIPAGYRKFDPQRLIDRIKLSDVWVDPPK
jgi:hypothetical protein